MKKVIKLLIGLVVLLVIGLVVAFLYLDVIVKKGVEKVGPAITKVDVRLNKANISPFSGQGELQGLVVGNPPEFKTPSAIQMGSVAVALDPGSVLSEKIVVRSIKVMSPEITFEGSLQGSNLGKILDNVSGTNSKEQPATKEEQQAKTRKLQVDEFVISGAKVNVSATLLGGKAATIPLPDIKLPAMGQGPEGITPAELTEKVLRAIVEGTVQAVGGAVGNVGQAVGNTLKSVGTNTTGTAEKAVKDIGNLFKKKQ